MVVDVIHVSAGHHDVIIVAQMIGEDVRWLILFWYYDKLMSFKEISELIVTPMHHGCARTVKNIVERFEETGQVRMLVLNACLWLMTRDRRRCTGVDFQVAGSTARRPDTSHIDVVHRPVLYLIIEQDPWRSVPLRRVGLRTKPLYTVLANSNPSVSATKKWGSPRGLWRNPCPNLRLFCQINKEIYCGLRNRDDARKSS